MAHEQNEQSQAGLICHGRAVFFYPPGTKKGWTLKRLIAVSLAGFLFWALAIVAIASAWKMANTFFLIIEM